jgi:mannose-6-phosphate isomerase
MGIGFTYIFTLDDERKEKLLTNLFLRIAADFPGDVGCWCIYLMNYVILKPGESMFLGPNVPHAYIYGGNNRFLFSSCTVF